MENKYFVPQIEDFRIGYEYEFQGIPKGWHKMIFSEENSLKTMKFNIENLKDTIRVPFLTKEQIEKEGYTVEDLNNDKYIKYKNDVNELHIHDYNGDTFYLGNCPSINEFRYICKLLKIE